MAGRFTPLHSSIWSDPDFVALSSNAQRVYLLAISQHDVSFAGVVPYTEKRWARMSNDATPGAIADGINELEDARFVLLDPDTEELMIRSYVKHGRIYEQKQLRKALVRGYESILSTRLRLRWYDEQVDEVKDLVGRLNENPEQAADESEEASVVGQGLDLDPQPATATGEGNEPARTFAHHALLLDPTPPLCRELDGDVAALIADHGDAKVTDAVFALLDEGPSKFPSQIVKRLKAILGPARKEPEAHVLDEAQRAQRAMAERDQAAWLDELARTEQQIPQTPEERRAFLARRSA